MFSYGKSDVYHRARARSSASRWVTAVCVLVGIAIVSMQVVVMSVWRPHSPGVLRQLEIRLIATTPMKGE